METPKKRKVDLGAGKNLRGCAWCEHSNEVIVNHGYCAKRCGYIDELDIVHEGCEYFEPFTKEL